LDVTGSNKKEILSCLSDAVVKAHPEIDVDKLVDTLVTREEAGSTAIADGIAIPHGKVRLSEKVIAGFGRSRTGVDFESVDGKPTQIFFVLVSPESHPSLHLRWLAHLAVLLKSPELRRNLLEAETAEEISEYIREQEQSLIERQ
jgi:PTS system nitrogen regulatory IIA component